MYRLLEVQLQLPDKESTKGPAPLATVFQVSGPATNKKPKKNLNIAKIAKLPYLMSEL